MPSKIQVGRVLSRLVSLTHLLPILPLPVPGQPTAHRCSLRARLLAWPRVPTTDRQTDSSDRQTAIPRPATSALARANLSLALGLFPSPTVFLTCAPRAWPAACLPGLARPSRPSYLSCCCCRQLSRGRRRRNRRQTDRRDADADAESPSRRRRMSGAGRSTVGLAQKPLTGTGTTRQGRNGRKDERKRREAGGREGAHRLIAQVKVGRQDGGRLVVVALVGRYYRL